MRASLLLPQPCCYQLLARIGSEAGAFENVAEGYLNSVRILRNDGLKLDALRLYEALVTLARRAGEHHAAAGILRIVFDVPAVVRRRKPLASLIGLPEMAGSVLLLFGRMGQSM